MTRCPFRCPPRLDHPQVLEGYASTCCLDLDRVQMRRFAFGYPLPKDLPPLLFKHDVDQPAGRVQSLEYDDEGNLRIRAVVDHPLARRMGAFSIGAKVLDYEMRDADGENFYALISSAELVEISCTDSPANPRALVKHRYPASAEVQFLEDVKQKVVLLAKLATLIGDHRWAS